MDIEQVVDKIFTEAKLEGRLLRPSTLGPSNIPLRFLRKKIEEIEASTPELNILENENFLRL